MRRPPDFLYRRLAIHDGYINDMNSQPDSNLVSQPKMSLSQVISERSSLPIAVFTSALLFFALMRMAISDNLFGTDFSVYWRTANQTATAAYLPHAMLPFPYAPTMLLWISPAPILRQQPAFFLFVAVSISVVVLACRRHLTPVETGLVLFSPPVITGLITGQVSIMLAALMLWAVTTNRRIVAGVALAVIASIKPQIVLLAPLMLLVNRDWRAIASSLLCFLFLIFASIVIFGWQRWPEWIASMSNFRSVLDAGNVLNIAATPASAAEHYGIWPLPFLVGGIVVGIWLTYQCRNSPPLAKCAAIAAASMLSAPYAMSYDLAAITPFLVYATFRGSLGSAVGLAGIWHPIPLVLAVLSLRKTGSAERIDQSRLSGPDQTAC